MKKTVTVNLNGRVFTMDEDAYHLLDNYLGNLRIYFRKEEDPKEIIADFEARIEELLSEKLQQGKQVITIRDIEEVISLMGNPSDFSTMEDEERKQERDREPYVETKRRLFRNPDDKMLGGVCSGIAAYFGWDVLPVRLIFIVLLFASAGWVTLAYFALWILLPLANTAEEKLQMKGKPITVENIGKTVSSATEPIKQNKGCLNGLLEFFVVLAKICLIGLGLIIGLPLAFALIVTVVVLFATLFGLGSGLLLAPASGWFIWASEPVLATVSLLFVILIPIIVIIYSIIAYFTKRKPLRSGIKWGVFIVWVIAFILFFSSGIKVDRSSWWQLFDEEWVSSKLVEGNNIPADTLITLPLLHSVELDGRLRAHLQIEQRPGEESCLLISGDANLLERINTRINHKGELEIRPKGNYRLRSLEGIKLYLQTPDLNEVEIAGAGHVEFAGAFYSDHLRLEIEGSGSISADSLYLKNLRANCDGSGEMKLAGEARNAQINVNGSGTIDALSLISDTVAVNINGWGEVTCDPQEHLDTSIKGSGKVRYKNEPKSKSTGVIGVSSIKSY